MQNTCYSKAYADDPGVLFSGEPQFWFASVMAAPPDESSIFDLDEVNWPLFRCIL